MVARQLSYEIRLKTRNFVKRNSLNLKFIIILPLVLNKQLENMVASSRKNHFEN